MAEARPTAGPLMAAPGARRPRVRQSSSAPLVGSPWRCSAGASGLPSSSRPSGGPVPQFRVVVTTMLLGLVVVGLLGTYLSPIHRRTGSGARPDPFRPAGRPAADHLDAWPPSTARPATSVDTPTQTMPRPSCRPRRARRSALFRPHSRSDRTPALEPSGRSTSAALRPGPHLQLAAPGGERRTRPASTPRSRDRGSHGQRPGSPPCSWGRRSTSPCRQLRPLLRLPDALGDA